MALVKNLLAEAPKPRSTNCAAHGCPLQGSIAGTTHPSDGTEWLCRHHFGVRQAKWPRITQQIRNGELADPMPLSLEAAQEVRARVAESGGKRWAHEVLALHAAGLYASDYGISMAREALKQEAA